MVQKTSAEPRLIFDTINISFMGSFLPKFLIRWVVSALGLWAAAGLLGDTRLYYGDSLKALLISSFILAVLNSLIKPVLVLLSLPAVLLSLGLFMLVINGLIILLVSELYSSLFVANFGSAVLAGIIVGLVNYLLSTILDSK